MFALLYLSVKNLLLGNKKLIPFKLFIIFISKIVYHLLNKTYVKITLLTA
jgi:hypothetical protein